jgi:hypothetical protein
MQRSVWAGQASSALTDDLGAVLQSIVSNPRTIIREARQFLRHAACVRSLSIDEYPGDISLKRNHFRLLFESVFLIETCVSPKMLSLYWEVEPQDNVL